MSHKLYDGNFHDCITYDTTCALCHSTCIAMMALQYKNYYNLYCMQRDVITVACMAFHEIFIFKSNNYQHWLYVCIR